MKRDTSPEELDAIAKVLREGSPTTNENLNLLYDLLALLKPEVEKAATEVFSPSVEEETTQKEEVRDKKVLHIA